MGTVDLHTHTSASDGLLSPDELVQLAAQRGLRVLGITDHDTVAGLAPAQAVAAQLGVTLVPGVELSTAVEAGEIHVLGYFIDPGQPALCAHLERLMEARRERAARIVEQLRRLGFPFTLEDLETVAQGGTITRAHAARLLLVHGYVSSIDEAFDRYLGRNRPAYVPRSYPSPRQAVEIVLAAGGVPVLAHPLSVHDLESVLAELVPAGLAGLEAWYAEYAPATQCELVDLARQWDLVPTGGSDYHGPAFRAGRELGSVEVPLEIVAELAARARYRERPATLPDQ